MSSTMTCPRQKSGFETTRYARDDREMNSPAGYFGMASFLPSLRMDSRVPEPIAAILDFVRSAFLRKPRCVADHGIALSPVDFEEIPRRGYDRSGWDDPPIEPETNGSIVSSLPR